MASTAGAIFLQFLHQGAQKLMITSLLPPPEWMTSSKRRFESTSSRVEMKAVLGDAAGKRVVEEEAPPVVVEVVDRLFREAVMSTMFTSAEGRGCGLPAIRRVLSCSLAGEIGVRYA